MRNKFLTEAMGEREAHMLCHPVDILSCVCDWGTKSCAVKHYDFSTWEGFGKLWEWAQGQDGWIVEFIGKYGYYDYVYAEEPQITLQLNTDIINPDRFADAVYEYLKEARNS